jgi:hypothetical protein
MLYFAGAEVTRVQCAYIGTHEVMNTCRQIADAYDDCRQKIICTEKPEKNPDTTLETLKEYWIGRCLRTYENHKHDLSYTNPFSSTNPLNTMNYFKSLANVHDVEMAGMLHDCLLDK